MLRTSKIHRKIERRKASQHGSERPKSVVVRQEIETIGNINGETTKIIGRDGESSAMLDLGLCVAILKMYARDKNLSTLNVLASKLGKEVKRQKSRMGEMAKDYDTRFRTYAQSSFHQRLEINSLEREIQNKDQVIQELEDSVHQRTFEEEERDEFDFNSKMQQVSAETKKSLNALREANHLIDLEQRMRKEFERQAEEMRDHIDQLKYSNNELMLYKLGFYDTLMQLKETEAGEEKLKERNILLRKEVDKSATELKGNIESLQRDKRNVAISHKKEVTEMKEHFETTIKRQEQKIKQFSTVLNDRNREILKLQDKLRKTEHKVLKVPVQQERLTNSRKNKSGCENGTEKPRKLAIDSDNRIVESRDIGEKGQSMQNLNNLQAMVEIKDREITKLNDSLNSLNHDSISLKNTLKEKDEQLTLKEVHLQDALSTSRKTENELQTLKSQLLQEMLSIKRQATTTTLESKTTAVGDIITKLNKATDIKHRLQIEVESKDNKIKELEKTADDSEGQLLVLKNQLHQFVSKLSETERELESTKAEKELERHTKQQLDRQLSNYNEHLKNENDTILKSKLEIIRKLERENEQICKEIKSVKDVFDKDKCIADLRETTKQLSDLRRQHHQTIQQLTDTEASFHDTRIKEQNYITKLERKHSELESRIKRLKVEKEHQITSQIQNIQQLENEAEQKNDKIEELEATLKHLNLVAIENESLRNRLTEAEEQMSQNQNQTLKSIEQIEAKLLETISEKEHEANTRQELEMKLNKQNICLNDMSELRNQLLLTSTELKEREDELEKAKSSSDHTQTKIKELQKQCRSYEDRLRHFREEMEKKLGIQKEMFQQKAEHNIKTLHEALADCKHENKQLMGDLKEVKTKLTDQRIQHDRALAKLTNTQGELNRTQNREDSQKNEDTLEEMAYNLGKALKKLKDTETELDETKTRLSKAMGDRLTDNNPNIADLSDKNRPIKLSERFSELYDNQWTDAFDILESHFDREKDVIKVLLDLLQDAMEFCTTYASKQLEDLQRILGISSDTETRNFPKDVTKQLKDCRKKISSMTLRKLYELYLEHLRKAASHTAKTAVEIRPFVEESLELCWLMSIQDPPVALAPVAKHGSVLNTDMYKHYTSSGTHVEYTVWPALLLHKGGPILAKGVAQGYGKKKK